MGKYSKTIVQLIATIAGAVPVIITFHTWQQVVSYLVPMVAATFGVYAVPNSPKGNQIP